MCYTYGMNVMHCTVWNTSTGRERNEVSARISERDSKERNLRIITKISTNHRDFSHQHTCSFCSVPDCAPRSDPAHDPYLPLIWVLPSTLLIGFLVFSTLYGYCTLRSLFQNPYVTKLSVANAKITSLSSVRG